MGKRVYGKITFANDYNRSFAEFKADFAENHVFLSIPENQREAEFVKAYRVAVPNSNYVPDNVIMIRESDEKGSETKTLKANGNIPGTTKAIEKS